FNPPGAQLYAFGEGRDGEIYALFANGAVQKLLGRQWLTAGSGSWNTSTNWLAGVPNVAGDSANFFARVTSGNATVALDGNHTVGSLRFNNASHGYTLVTGTGSNALTINNASSHGLLQVISGSHAVNVPVNIAGSTDI